MNEESKNNREELSREDVNSKKNINGEGNISGGGISELDSIDRNRVKKNLHLSKIINVTASEYDSNHSEGCVDNRPKRDSVIEMNKNYQTESLTPLLSSYAQDDRKTRNEYVELN